MEILEFGNRNKRKISLYIFNVLIKMGKISNIIIKPIIIIQIWKKQEISTKKSI